MHPRILRVIVCALATATSIACARQALATSPTIDECISANEQSIVLRRASVLRAAKRQLLVCEAASCPAEVRNECIRRAADVSASTPTALFVVKDSSGNQLTAVQVIMDGELLSEQLDGTPIALDPGTHTFIFEAAGQPAATKQLVVREGEKDRREIIELGAAPNALAPSPPSPPPTEEPPPSLPSTPTETMPSHGLGTQRILAIAAAGVGVAGVAMGAVFGFDSMAKHDDAVKVCPRTTCPDENGVDLWNRARSSGDLSTVGFVVGAVGLAGGAALWFTAPAPEESGVHVGVGPGSLQMRFVW